MGTHLHPGSPTRADHKSGCLVLFPAMYDILILNGRIVTGMGNPWFYGDIGVTGGVITAVGRINCGTARTVIDAERRT